MKRLSMPALVTAAILALANPLSAGNAQQGSGLQLPSGDARAARSLIAEHCIKCHLVLGFPSDRLQPAVKAPPFHVIANDPQRYPDQALRAFLRKPHYPMQGFVLSERDIDNIIAFLHTLRRKSSRKKPAAK